MSSPIQYVVVQPSGRRGYAVRYRFGGRPCKLTLKAGITLAAARKLAAAALFEVAEGRNPSEAKRERLAKVAAAATNTLRAICSAYFATEAGGKNLRTSRRQQKDLERVVYPTFGNRPIDDIKRSDIAKLLGKRTWFWPTCGGS
jgi:hypothetical protein